MLLCHVAKVSAKGFLMLCILVLKAKGGDIREIRAQDPPNTHSKSLRFVKVV